jgi:hypothetical protein
MSAQRRWDNELVRAELGALIGGGVGLLLASPAFLIVPVWLAAGALGAGIGFAVTGGLPLVQAGIDYFGGHP